MRRGDGHDYAEPADRRHVWRRARFNSSRPAARTPAETESNPPGDIPDNQVYVPFTAQGGRMSVKVDEEWARSSTGTATQFSDKLNRIEIALGLAGSAPTVASVTSSEVPKLKSSTPNFAMGNVTTERRAGSTVVLVRYHGDSPQDPVTGKAARDAFGVMSTTTTDSGWT